MSLTGISPLTNRVPVPTTPGATASRGVEQGRVQPHGGATPPAVTYTPSSRPAAAAAAGAAAARGAELPAEAPAGTDPALWSVLTGEERSFLAKAATMGPLTYGRTSAAASSAVPAAARGARLDVRA